MAPSRKRAIIERKPVAAHGSRNCPCLQQPHSSGICSLNVWLGTMIDPDHVSSGQRLLRPNLPVVKYKMQSLTALSGHMYHLIVLGWPTMLALFTAFYVFVVGVFALLFAACGMNFADPSSRPRDYFNLSLQTMATIGYGVLFPTDSCSNWVAVLESFVSMIIMAVMTGVAFVKFARPRSYMIFSEVFTVSQRESGGLEMRFRIVNGTQRDVISRGEIIEASFKLILMRVEDATNGGKKLCYYDLNLKTSNFITLRLEADIVHRIEQDSPFFGMTQEDIVSSDFLLILMMSGVDENLHDMVHHQIEYTQDSMRWGAKFSPVVEWDNANKRVVLDFKFISETIPAPIDRSYTVSEIDTSAVALESCTTDDESPPRLSQLNGIVCSDDSSGLYFKRRLHSSISTEINHDREANIVDNSDLESTEAFHDAEALGAEERGSNSSKSAISTRTNSGSEKDEGNGQLYRRRVRFDQHRRSNRFHLNWGTRRAYHRSPSSTVHEQPMSLLRRRVRFKNHPLSRFSKGLYYHALETSWLRLFGLLALMYFSAIALVAVLIHVSSASAVLQASSPGFVEQYLQIFYFSAQTISTIGYGALSPNPQDDVVNFYVALLTIVGIVVSTLLTGLAWAKFSIPNASTILFSDNLLLTAFHGHRAIMFRAANNRTFGTVIEGSFRVSVVLLNRQMARKETHELQLCRNVWPIVQIDTTVTHIIDETSPLYMLSTDELLSGDHYFVVLFTGLDSVIVENMFARRTYHSCDILVGHHFVDNVKLAVDGLHIDLEAINETILMPDIDLQEFRLYMEPPPIILAEDGNPEEKHDILIEQGRSSWLGNEVESPKSSYSLM